jgi:hypothetical protein
VLGVRSYDRQILTFSALNNEIFRLEQDINFILNVLFINRQLHESCPLIFINYTLVSCEFSIMNAMN